MANAQIEKAKLIYVGDPMCSWCYGFSPEFSKASTSLDDKVNFEMIMGGLRPYNTQQMPELADFLKEHWQHVEERSGQPFNTEVLSKPWKYDTEPPSRAVIVVRDMAPDKELDFFKAIQKTFYQDNQNTNLTATYSALAAAMGLDKGQFEVLFESQQYKEKTRQDFEKAAEMGIRGFPSVVVEYNGRLHLIANGYAPATQIIDSVHAIIE